ncbi:hypothetical protein BO82DRAFT_364793 [Aspergillus uvarum CBS 121591]|uniref:Uncharacterized protein n=1 Tax=Aspergillus uvarum CBS 121591 TaxID=1448315 RepID=A0A319C7W7_9EURO|nr:hypothetical protein BO82DRAFT_364793 [Aspergillus uvarum CBS 121591]PYH81916.1 hypothetical protein BO82DRAFT_364793 [Aspergillus uvarum CBS 121591]
MSTQATQSPQVLRPCHSTRPMTGVCRRTATSEIPCSAMSPVQGQPCTPQYIDPSLLCIPHLNPLLIKRSSRGMAEAEKQAETPNEINSATRTGQTVPRERPERSQIDSYRVLESFRLTPNENALLLDLLPTANPTDSSPYERDSYEEEFWANYVHLLNGSHALAE